ncbi:hypothetical protein DL96DRAFT_1467390 [Flagelloscypha sp. PMI_526]|nr:hypothetical protein DL96DRAFT_1467390 [Flagelloscypha sp. PMI_526]
MSATTSPLLSPEHELQENVEAVNAQLADLDVAPDAHADTSLQSNGGASVARTVAIIKPHALQHRFDIERKVQEAGFEIVKERQMEFDVETDPDTLYELFGEDAESFAEGPVWVYVLERRRAVEVWINLMGDRDPEVARREAPNSIRALYGISRSQNGILGSTDREIAEIQIASLFASSPPFPTSELPEDQYGTVNSVSSSVLAALHRGNSDGSVTSGTSSRKVHNSRPPVNKLFTARELPATHLKPDIAPRTTKAAALRAGIVTADRVGSMGRLPANAARNAISKDRHKETFGNVPGHKRAETITVASTAAPTIAPRMTKAAALRQGIKPVPTQVKRMSSAPAASNGAGAAKSRTFEGVPGHKRNETITVASVAAPTIAPRMTKAAALRQGPKAPPTSFMFRASSLDGNRPAGLARSNSLSSLSGNRQPRPASQMSNGAPLSRTTSTTSSVANGDSADGSVQAEETKPKRVVPRPSSVGVPTIAPRTNKSAALRAAKKAEEEERAKKEAERARKASRRTTIGVAPRSIAA